MACASPYFLLIIMALKGFFTFEYSAAKQLLVIYSGLFKNTSC